MMFDGPQVINQMKGVNKFQVRTNKTKSKYNHKKNWTQHMLSEGSPPSCIFVPLHE